MLAIDWRHAVTYIATVLNLGPSSARFAPYTNGSLLFA